MIIDHTILVADDDLDDQEMLKAVMEEIEPNRYQFAFANNGEEVLKKLAQLEESGELLCLIVLDINMPKMNGIETLITIKSNPKTEHIATVLLSTALEESGYNRFTKTGVEYFIKPVDYRKFRDVRRSY
jgi:CheY-like chemotaxis protein